MDEGWIITTAITLGIGVISYFLKRTMTAGKAAEGVDESERTE